MQKKLPLMVLAVCCSTLAQAQSNQTQQAAKSLDENAFTFTEAQLGEDDNMSQNVTILNSTTNAYASEVGFLFSPMRFRYRAFNQKYNEIFINGAPVNDIERGQFAFSSIGGLNQQTRNVDFSLPFEANNYGMTAMAGSNNYNFRSGSMSTGQRISLAGANRNYTLRGMYTYNSGFNAKGWAFSAGLTYRWANRGYVEGTFYNALSYFLGVQKLMGSHSLSFATWGNPTERGAQGAATDESFWIANNNQYNPYWGYQNGKRRNSRVVNDFAPTALLTWDWNINNTSKLTTTLLGKYSLYKSTKLNYNNADNPQPDYYKLLPSNFYDVWGNNARFQTAQNLADWRLAYEWLSSDKAHRQINWDQLYAANRNINQQGGDAMYYVQARYNNNLYFTLASTLTKHFSAKNTLNVGVTAATNKGFHYQTMDDLLGANNFHNINNYAIGTYAANSSAVQYDLNRMNAQVKEGDRFGYDYTINIVRGNAWASYTETFRNIHYSVAGKIGYDGMNRDGKMRNGLFANNSFGKSKTANFLSGGGKTAASIDLSHGHVFSLGLGLESKAPTAYVAFQAAEMNNDFVRDLKNELIFSSEASYQYSTSWLHANLNAYYSYVGHATEWTCFYFDDINSFSYNALSNLKKAYYGVELGLRFKLTSYLDLKAIGTLSEAKNMSNAHVRYLNSTQGVYNDDEALVKGMRESGTPLTAANLGLSFHQGGWFIDLNGNYYDRIYLGYSPYYRYASALQKIGSIDSNGNYIVSPQDKGHGGFMLDASIGKSIRLKKGSLSINLMVTNLLNNQKIVTGGYEQSRSDYSIKNDGSTSSRTYSFSRNPKKYYAYGMNGMLQVAYKF